MLVPNTAGVDLTPTGNWSSAPKEKYASQFSDPTVAQLLLQHQRQETTGVLEIRSGKLRTRLHLINGKPVFAELGRPRSGLGQLLLRDGAITSTQYGQVIAAMTETLPDHEQVAMGEWLVKLGILDTSQVYAYLCEQLETKILDCLELETYESSLEDESALISASAALEVRPLEQLVLRGMHTHFHGSRLLHLVRKKLDLYPVLTTDVRQTSERLGLSVVERNLLRRARGRATLQRLAETSELGAEHSMQILATLWLAGVLDFRQTRAVDEASRPNRAVESARRRRSEYLHIAADRDASPAKLQKDATSSQAAPVRSSLGRIKTTVDKRRRKRVAASRLRRPTIAPPEPSVDDRCIKEAAAEFARGRQMLRYSRPRDAVKYFAKAVELNSGSVEYQLCFEWLEYVLASKQIKRVESKARARNCALKLLKQGDHLRAHVVLGHFLREDGERDAARRHIKRALEMDPKDIEAQRESRQLNKAR